MLFTYPFLLPPKTNIIIIGLYKICFINNLFFFFIFIVLYSVLMVKLNCINKKACLINLVLPVPNYVFHYFLDSILMVPFKF